MKLRIITPNLHGVADYSAGIGLILAPLILPINDPNAVFLSVISGIAVLIASAMTCYRLGIFRTIPFQVHLAIDMVVAITFLVAIKVMNFEGLAADYFQVNSAVVFLVVSLSDTK